MDHNDLTAVWVTFGSFGGVALIIWTSIQGKIARIKAEAQARQMTTAPLPDDRIIAELKALKQQIAEMQSTSHQFDISFDEALSRLESRVSRIETKAATSTTAATEEIQHIGQR